MMSNITPKTILRHELIGLKIKVVKSAHKGLYGIYGTIIDETMNTLVINHEGTPKVVPKEHCIFHCILPNNIVEIDGKLLSSVRPEDRTKKRW